MTLQRNLTIPAFFIAERGCLAQIRERLQEHNLIFNRPLVLSGPTRTRAIAARLVELLSLAPERQQATTNNSASEVTRIGATIDGQQFDAIVAVGGGKVLDVAKMVSYQHGLPLVAIPTTLSSDGMASPIAVIRGDRGYHESVGACVPIAVLVDLDIVRSAPIHTLQAGVGDLLSNLSAIEDWKLASRINGERVDSFAMLVARNAAETFLHLVADHPEAKVSLHDERILARLAEGLLMSGLAMAIAGTSRPCSGAEHLISHALDRILPEPLPHGLQVGVATLFVELLRGHDIAPLAAVYDKLGIPGSPDALGISAENFLEAVRRGPSMRPGRKTSLDSVNLGTCADVLEEVNGHAIRCHLDPVPIPGRD